MRRRFTVMMRATLKLPSSFLSVMMRGPLKLLSLFLCLCIFAMMCSTITILIVQSVGELSHMKFDPEEDNVVAGFHAKNRYSYKSKLKDLRDFRSIEGDLSESRYSDVIRRQKQLLLEQNRPADEHYNFNVTASDLLPCDRKIADTRPGPCRLCDSQRLYPGGVRTLRVSVIIPFYNEALSVLLRTVHSVIARTPDRNLKQILLIDDCSTYNYLQDSNFVTYWRLLPKTRLVRLTERRGLIRARLHGADLATGDVLVFLDAHVECNVGWLEPLLSEISQNPKSIVQPFVDGIDAANMEYSGPDILAKSGFTWDLRYVWMEIPAHQQTLIRTQARPYPASSLVGCAFAVDKAFFFDVGAFDPSFQIWGGENIEMAFRVWMCGGLVLTVPCSRVGHVFKEIPYPDDVSRENAWLRNLARVAEVWMDDFRKYFHASIGVHDPEWIKFNLDSDQTITDRKRLRKHLQCEPFQWYLDNVLPELPLPPRDAAYHGEIVNQRSNACWEITEDRHVTVNFRCYQHKMIIQNYFTLTTEGLLLYKDKCVKFLFPTPSLIIEECPDINNIKQFGVWGMRMRNGDRKWGQLQVTLNLENDIKTWCIEHLTSAVSPHRDQQMAQTAPRCDDNNKFQFWSFTYRFKYD